MLIAVVSAVAFVQVKVNRDMTEYLPEDMQMSQGMDIMDEQFGESSLLNVMVEGVDEEDRSSFADTLAAFDCIDTVSYEKDDPTYNDGDYALYQLSLPESGYTDEADEAIELVRSACESRGYQCWFDGEGLNSAAADLGPVFVGAVIIAMVILFVLAASWIEPLILLFVILIAVLINCGSNIFQGTISETTNAISAVLQMVLSMDYLIMLLNRYRREKEEGASPELAMEQALRKGVTAIASSSVTTVAGLLCLVLMSFTIGRDLGFVLAKGVLLSLICAFACMPAVVLASDYFMERTAKPTIHPQMRHLAAFSYAARIPLTILFVVIFVVGLTMRGLATTEYVTDSKNPDLAQIQEHFDLSDQMVILFNLDDQEAVDGLLDQLEGLEGTDSLSSYATTIGKQYTADQMADQMDMDAGLLRMLYYDDIEEGQPVSMTGSQLVEYTRSGLAADLASLIDDDTAENLESLADLMEGDLDGEAEYTVDEATEALSSHASIHASTVRLIYLAYSGSVACDEAWTLSTEELMTFIHDDVLNDSTFEDMLDDESRQQMDDAYDTVQSARDKFIAQDYGRVIIMTSLDAESTEMDAYVTQVRTALDEAGVGEYYLVGQGAMVQEMAASFQSEFDFISIVTVVAILLIVLITFRNLLIPIVLVALIQSAFCWDMAFSMLMSTPVYYVAMIAVQSILMGSTIDYAILYTTTYREAREDHDIRESVGLAYRNSIRTICMSGSILVLVCFAMGVGVEGITGQICMIISEGSFAAVSLVLVVLPGVISALDRWFVPKHIRQHSE